jgi:ABC-type glycerol-3-phosphate transport system substrate-binding protein
MKKTTLIILLTITLLIITACSGKETIKDDPNKITIYYFWEKGCLSCDVQDEFMKEIQQRYENVEIKSFDAKEPKNRELLKIMTEAYNERVQAAPITFISDEAFIGFGDAQTTGKLIEDIIKKCQVQKCKNPAEII